METEKIKKTTRELVLKMDRDEIMDFLIQCQSHFAIELPSGREKEIWNNGYYLLSNYWFRVQANNSAGSNG